MKLSLTGAFAGALFNAAGAGVVQWIYASGPKPGYGQAVAIGSGLLIGAIVGVIGKPIAGAILGFVLPVSGFTLWMTAWWFALYDGRPNFLTSPTNSNATPGLADWFFGFPFALEYVHQYPAYYLWLSVVASVAGLLGGLAAQSARKKPMPSPNQ